MLFNTTAQLFNSLMSDSGNNEAAEVIVGGTQLQPTMLPIEKLHFSMLPQELLSTFTFKEEWIVQPKRDYEATSLVISVVPVRLDEQGKLALASPSIKNARYGTTSNYPTFDEENERARFKPDVFVQADFFTDGEVLLPVPTVMKQPYPVAGSNVSVALSDATKKTEGCETIWNTARRDMERRLGKIAKHLGVPANEQFLLVLVGCPSMAKVIKGGDDKPIYGVAFPNGGYFLGATKLSSGRSLPDQLSDLKVKPSMMIGGKSLQAKLEEQLINAKAQLTEVPAAAPPVIVLEQELEPEQILEPVFPAATSSLKQSGLLDLLGTPDSADAEFQMLDDDEPAHQATLKKGPSPFGL